MKSLKKFALATMTCAALLGFAATSHAAYQLSDEVKTATPALLMATEIGVKSNTNAALANLPDKSAIVVMSFGTTFKDTRAKTIDATVEAIKAAHPGVKVVTAFTSCPTEKGRLFLRSHDLLGYHSRHGICLQGCRLPNA